MADAVVVSEIGSIDWCCTDFSALSRMQIELELVNLPFEVDINAAELATIDWTHRHRGGSSHGVGVVLLLVDLIELRGGACTALVFDESASTQGASHEFAITSTSARILDHVLRTHTIASLLVIH